MMEMVVTTLTLNGHRVKKVYYDGETKTGYVMLHIAHEDKYVTAVITPLTLAHHEWALGHYFRDEREAERDFWDRVPCR